MLICADFAIISPTAPIFYIIVFAKVSVIQVKQLNSTGSCKPSLKPKRIVAVQSHNPFIFFNQDCIFSRTRRILQQSCQLQQF